MRAATYELLCVCVCLCVVTQVYSERLLLSLLELQLVPVLRRSLLTDIKDALKAYVTVWAETDPDTWKTACTQVWTPRASIWPESHSSLTQVCICIRNMQYSRTANSAWLSASRAVLMASMCVCVCVCVYVCVCVCVCAGGLQVALLRSLLPVSIACVKGTA